MAASMHDAILTGAKAIFAYRVSAANDKEPQHRHPMLYRDSKWDELPVSEKVYYVDMAISAFTAVGLDCTDSPVFENTAA